jgi:hypothetical protein
MKRRLFLRGFLLIGERARTKKNRTGKANGAQGRDRTTDTAIFSRMLYQLSYLGTSGAQKHPERAVYSQAGRPCPPRFISGYARRSHAEEGKASPHGPKGRAATDHRTAASEVIEYRLSGVLVGVRFARNGVGAGQPAVQVDVATAVGTKRLGSLGRRLAADRA